MAARRLLSPELAIALPLLCYLALPTRNFYWDGVAFAINIEKHLPAASLLHPSHLIYSLAGEWIYRLCEMAGLPVRALFLLQTINSVLAGLCVFLFYKSVPQNGVAAALVFAFSATWWKFATDANAYVPSIFFLLIAYLLLHRRPKSVIAAGLAQAGALLFHELAILFLPVALFRLRKSPRSALKYAATALIPVTAAYLIAYTAVSKRVQVPGFLSWIAAHAPDSAFYFNPLTDAAFSIRGTLRLFFGGKLSDFVSDGISKAALAALLIATVVFIVGIWRLKRTSILPPPRDLFVWAGVYCAFLFVWMPQNTFYRLFYLPPLVALLASITRNATWLLVPILFTWNFCFDIYPQSKPDRNAPMSFALAQRTRWAPGTPIVFHTFHPDLWTISYFSQQAAWINIEQPDIAELERSLAYARTQNSPLWLEADAYDLFAAHPDGQRWLAIHERPTELLEAKDEKHDFRFHCIR